MINFSLSFVLVSSVTGWQNDTLARTKQPPWDACTELQTLPRRLTWEGKQLRCHSYLVPRAREINAKCLRITGVAFWTEGNGVEVNMAVADISQSVFQETVIPRVHPISPHQNVWILRQARMAKIPSLTVGESRNTNISRVLRSSQEALSGRLRTRISSHPVCL